MNRRTTAYLAIVIFVFLQYGAARVVDGEANLSGLRLVSVAALACTAVLWVVEKYAWRWPPLQVLAKVPPDLNGTWKGSIESFWGPDGQSASVPAYLVIHQMLSSVEVHLFTEESESATEVGRVASAGGGRWVLQYLYQNTPKIEVRKVSPIHYGSAVLRVEGPKASALAGNYFTDRRSAGTLRLAERRAQVSASFIEAGSLFS